MISSFDDKKRKNYHLARTYVSFIEPFSVFSLAQMPLKTSFNTVKIKSGGGRGKCEENKKENNDIIMIM